MSFDIDPDEKYERILMYHPESDCVYEVFSRTEMACAVGADGMSMEVTGEEKFESRFKAEREAKNSK